MLEQTRFSWRLLVPLVPEVHSCEIGTPASIWAADGLLGLRES
jgi:hypothetical protein